MCYFDPTYFDPTYFDVCTTATGGRGGRVGPIPAPIRRTDDGEELFVLLI